MTKNIVSKSEFSRIIGKSPSYVGKLSAQDRLTLVQQGKRQLINLFGTETLQYLSSVKHDLDIDLESDDDEAQDKQPAVPVPRSPETLEERRLKIQKLKEQIQQIRIQNEQRRGNLVEKRLVEIVFGKVHQVDNDEWKSLGYHMEPSISAIYNEFNTQKTTEILELFGLSPDDRKKADISMILNSKQDLVKTRLLELFEDETTRVLRNVKRLISDFLQSLAADTEGDDTENQEVNQ